MTPPLTIALCAALVLLAVLAVIATVRGRQVDNATFWVTAVVEVLMIAQLIAGIALRNDAPHGMSSALWLSYLGAMVFVPPAAFLWAIADRETPWGTGVLAVAALSMLVMMARLVQIWNGQG
ncbi:hypothetical protein ACMYYO_05010 [Dermacoccaceae bacterium W4C1]